MMKNKAFTFAIILLTSLLLMFIVLSSYVGAYTKYVYDDAELFTINEVEEIQLNVAKIIEEIRIDIAIVTTEVTEGKSSWEYADQFFIDYDLGIGENKDGLIFLINLDSREIFLYTSGITISYFTDERIDLILDQVYTSFSNELYLQGVVSFLNEVENYFHQGIDKDAQEVSVEPIEEEISIAGKIVVYLFLSMIIAAIVVGIMAYSSKSRSTVHKGTYLENGSIQLTQQKDHHFNTNVTHRIVNNTSSKSTRSSVGRASVGRSTVRRSSSGRSSGGRGRKF